MGFILVPSTTNTTQVVSLPNLCSFVVQDDGGGGNAYVNGLGVGNAQVSNAVDLKTFVTGLGVMWRSAPLLRAFRLVPTNTQQDASAQFISYLDISYYFLNGVGTTNDLGFTYLCGLSGGGDGVPYLSFAGPGAAGLWRVNLRLRHSITN